MLTKKLNQMNNSNIKKVVDKILSAFQNIRDLTTLHIDKIQQLRASYSQTNDKQYLLSKEKSLKSKLSNKQQKKRQTLSLDSKKDSSQNQQKIKLENLISQKKQNKKILKVIKFKNQKMEEMIKRQKIVEVIKRPSNPYMQYLIVKTPIMAKLYKNESKGMQKRRIHQMWRNASARQKQFYVKKWYQQRQIYNEYCRQKGNPVSKNILKRQLKEASKAGYQIKIQEH